MSALPKYERYKASDVEWLGDVPNHWEVRSLRGILKERGETNEGTKTDFILSVMKDRGVIPYTEKGNVGNKMSEDITTYKLVCPGDLVINKMNAIIGSLGISEYHGALSKVYFVMQPRYEYLNNRYYGYLFQIRDFQKSLCKISYGIMELRESINFNEFKNLPLPLPPKPEQDRIVAFLDLKTAEIDALIAKKQRQIELLDEQKAILIHRAVTRGHNPNAKLKPSGIEWIGEIPEHWEVNRIYSIFNERVETGFDQLPMLNVTIGRGVSLEDFQGDRPKRLIEDRNIYKRACVGDIAYNMMRMWQGAVGNVEIEGLISPAYVVARPIRPISAAYFSFMFRGKAFQVETNKFSYGIVSDRNRLYWLGFKSIFVPYPPIAEQEAIAEHAAKIGKTTDMAKEKIQDHIQSLQTLRSTLIAHAVTGRIKV